MLINNRESVDLNHFSDPKAFTECSNDMDDIYENIDKYNPNGKCKILIEFDDKFADMLVADNGFTCCTHKKN